MATVQSTNTVNDPFAAINAATNRNNSTTASEDPQDRFLKLLVSQLKNQDPLNPLDNAQVTSQLAQMSTVSGIERLNTSLSSLIESVGNSQSMQAAEMIGKNVLVPGSRMSLAKGVAFAGVSLAAAADQVTLSILDASGTVIQSQKLGAREPGVFNIAWDGMTDAGVAAPDGTYTFSVKATRGNDTVTAEALQVGTVSALVRAQNGFLLDLGALGTVDFKSVYQII